MVWLHKVQPGWKNNIFLEDRKKTSRRDELRKNMSEASGLA